MNKHIKLALLGLLSLSLVTIIGCKKAEEASTQAGSEVTNAIEATTNAAEQAKTEAAAEVKAAEEHAVDAIQAAKDAAAVANK